MKRDASDELVKPAGCAANFPISYNVEQLIELNISTAVGTNVFDEGGGTAGQDEVTDMNENEGQRDESDEVVELAEYRPEQEIEPIHGDANDGGPDGPVEEANVQPEFGASENKAGADDEGGSNRDKEFKFRARGKPFGRVFGYTLNLGKPCPFVWGTRFVGGSDESSRGEIIEAQIMRGGPNLTTRGGGARAYKFGQAGRWWWDWDDEDDDDLQLLL